MKKWVVLFVIVVASISLLILNFSLYQFKLNYNFIIQNPDYTLLDPFGSSYPLGVSEEGKDLVISATIQENLIIKEKTLVVSVPSTNNKDLHLLKIKYITEPTNKISVLKLPSGKFEKIQSWGLIDLEEIASLIKPGQQVLIQLNNSDQNLNWLKNRFNREKGTRLEVSVNPISKIIIGIFI
ncbi:MAG: hypothetical protein UV74_C0001G0033 [Candidatus Woesebacteria bacterium GW2011_GWB1_43_14]|uniref:Uncharacterized protein n=1 Tax=Candidatus Woesebacteria bacterium GW2011_GWB1_43_14 TaxID=1618578 RepID=A0A0G1GJH1_9BACT|nr:MAG: hypothetical protein UV51_C0002G0022 [Candidatus Woesebacteria bacterium GW2011_GWC1_42_9]KKS98923.1 MAG: hypothetical protein UV74_C0001G0033 [Candidatus Woesebacteria bacterium GW2011_GWB1_43_14]